MSICIPDRISVLGITDLIVPLITDYYFFSPVITVPVMINLIQYTKLIGFRTIVGLVEDNQIDTVYVRFAWEDKDRKFDCMKPSDMLNLKYIIGERNPRVVGWRLHHNHRDEFDLALANAIMQSNEEI